MLYHHANGSYGYTNMAHCIQGLVLKAYRPATPLYSGHLWDRHKCPDYKGVLLSVRLSPYKEVPLCAATVAHLPMSRASVHASVSTWRAINLVCRLEGGGGGRGREKERKEREGRKKGGGKQQ